VDAVRALALVDDDTNRRARAVLTYLGTDGQPG
jgi:hypothetical protein